MIVSGMELLPGVDVSRETLQRLQAFQELVLRWTARINLIAPSTAADIWNRHILDSAQLVGMVGVDPRSWADLGAGAGFPGLVVASVAAEKWPRMTMTLVESDQRKATFLRTAARQLNLAVTVHDQRIESLPPLGVQVLSARALAPLTVLLGHASRHLASDGVALFPKGRTHAEEIESARKTWRFSLAILPSVTEVEGRILRIERIERA